MVTPTAAGTRPGGAIASAWSVMHYLGVEGYCAKAKLVTDTRKTLMSAIQAMQGLHTLGDPKLGLFAYGSDEVDIYGVYAALHKRGWFTGLNSQPRAIHLMLSPAHAEVADRYLEDLSDALDAVRAGRASGEGTTARYS